MLTPWGIKDAALAAVHGLSDSGQPEPQAHVVHCDPHGILCTAAIELQVEPNGERGAAGEGCQALAVL